MREKDQPKKKNPKSEPCTPSGKLVVLLYVKCMSLANAQVQKTNDRKQSFRPASSIGQQLFKNKDKADPIQMADAVCNVGCKNCYIGETTRHYDGMKPRQRQRRSQAPEPSPNNREKTTTALSTRQLWRNIQL